MKITSTLAKYQKAVNFLGFTLLDTFVTFKKINRRSTILANCPFVIV